MTKYTINFTNNGKCVQSWAGYLTYADALSAIRDADLLIPWTWETEITSEGERK
jgi:hypothetical protein|tara:strand:+ start:572 stop:733 length:162 start_codon:yes stop_codon:yes gene_type:complete